MNWKGKKVLVTGAGGFIGSHLTERLVREGADVRAFVRYTSSGAPGLLSMLDNRVQDDIECIRGDLTDHEAVRGAVRGREIVFHLAALIAIPYSYVHPTDVVKVNVNGTQNVLNAALAEDACLVVNTSTSEVYGTARYAPIDEAHPIQAQSPYSASKISADAITKAYHLSFGLPVATLRPFNTYGPRQSGRAVIPTIIAQALFRDRIELGALTPTRDLCFVDDTVDGFLKVAANPEAHGRVTNVGTGTEISIGDLAARVIALLGKDMEVVSREERMRPDSSEVFRLLCDAGWARENIGWEARTSLDDGLTKVIEFIRAHPDWVNAAEYQV